MSSEADQSKEATIRKAVVWKLAETAHGVADPFFGRLKVPVPTEPIHAFVIPQSTLEHSKEDIQKSLWILARCYFELRKLGDALPNTVENALLAYLLTCRIQNADGIAI